MTELEAFNQIRALLGLPPINDTETQSKSVAILRDSLRRAKKRIIRKAWRKFGHYVTLTPNSSGEIDVSAYMRVVYPLSVRSRLTERNGKVWDIKNNVAYATAIEQAFVLSDIDFAQISSATWAEYITLEAAVDMAQRTNDVDANYAVIAEQRNQARRQAYNESRVTVDGGFGVNSALSGFYD